MVSFSSILADANGNIIINELPSSDYSNTTRRVTRVKTLDGGCVFVDGGFSHSDKNFTIVTEYSANAAEIIQYLHENKALINIGINNNFYTGVILSVKIKTNIRIEILIKEKLN